MGPALLAVVGPRLEVEVSVSTAYAEQIAKQGGTVATPHVGHALIDTGATRTCVDVDAIAKLGVPAVDRMPVLTPSGSETQSVHPVRLTFVGTGLGSVDAIPVLASKLGAQGILALIGRDILAQCVLIYNGPGGHFTITV